MRTCEPRCHAWGIGCACRTPQKSETDRPKVTTQLAMDAIAWGRAPAYTPKGRPNLRVLCADGFSASVQASSWHYANDSSGGRAPYWSLDDEAEPAWPFITFEVGYPSADPPSTWDEYEGGGVWAFVPRALIESLLDDHGGAVGWTRTEKDDAVIPPASETVADPHNVETVQPSAICSRCGRVVTTWHPKPQCDAYYDETYRQYGLTVPSDPGRWMTDDELRAVRAAAWDEGYSAARQVVELDGVNVWAHTVMPQGYEGNPYRNPPVSESTAAADPERDRGQGLGERDGEAGEGA